MRNALPALPHQHFTDRYPGFDLDDPDWVLLNQQLEAVGRLLETVTTRTAGT
jgi:hypothetical protein